MRSDPSADCGAGMSGPVYGRLTGSTPRSGGAVGHGRIEPLTVSVHSRRAVKEDGQRQVNLRVAVGGQNLDFHRLVARPHGLGGARSDLRREPGASACPQAPGSAGLARRFACRRGLACRRPASRCCLASRCRLAAGSLARTGRASALPASLPGSLRRGLPGRLPPAGSLRRCLSRRLPPRALACRRLLRAATLPRRLAGRLPGLRHVLTPFRSARQPVAPAGAAPSEKREACTLTRVPYDLRRIVAQVCGLRARLLRTFDAVRSVIPFDEAPLPERHVDHVRRGRRMVSDDRILVRLLP
jgi:hypothetical protein